MLMTLELPTELEQKLQNQAELQQVSLSELVEKLLYQFLDSELTMEEIERLYTEEWVLVEITEFDDHEDPLKGIVVAHDVDREAIVEPGRQLHLQKPGVKSFTFFAGSIVPDDTVVVI